VPTQYQSKAADSHRELRLTSDDGTNRLTLELIRTLTDAVLSMQADAKPLILTGGEKFFSAGADLFEIQALNATTALEFAKAGHRLMNAIANFPAPVYAAINGYCMGGGLDLALACHWRIASPHAVFGHRGAALGLMTGWGGTQRLPQIIGRGRALALFVTAEKIHAREALGIGLVDAIAEDPVAEAGRRIQNCISADALLLK
jgi:enoyl-CoA hydratase/carnithine racemase